MKNLFYAMGFVCALGILPSCKKIDKLGPNTQATNISLPPDMAGQGTVSVKLISRGCDFIQPTLPDGTLNSDNSTAKDGTHFSAINLDIRQVKVYDAVNGWQALKVDAGIYDLITLQNAIGAQIANNTSIKAGGITKLSIGFGRENSVKVKDKIFCMHPSVNEVTVDMKAQILAEHIGQITLSIDFCDAIHLQDQYDQGTCYVLTPKITFKDFKGEIM